MTENISSEPTPPPGTTNRGLVVVLSCATICVLAFGIWILTGRDQPPPSPDHVTALGSFYMPAEFEPQDILYLGGEQLALQHPDIMTAIVRAVAPEVRTAILTSSIQGRSTIDSLFASNGLAGARVVTLPVPEMSMWLRDFGPLTVTDTLGRRSMVEFNCGERRCTRFDDDVPSYLSVQLGLAILGNRLQVEGGDLLTNGRGFGVASTRVVEGNAGYHEKGIQEIVQIFASMLGLEKVLLVPPLVGESTGHVDMFCTFVAADLVVVGSLNPAMDAENAQQLDMIAQDLEGLPTLAGPLRVERVRQPDHADGVWRSYTNVVFANGVVLVPVYPGHCPDLDAQALAFYRRLLPDRRIVAIDASGLAHMNGNLRCVTVNVPVGGPLVDGITVPTPPTPAPSSARRAR